MCLGDAYSMDRTLYFSVLKRSCCGPILYLAYPNGMEGVVQPLSGMDIHEYAGDHGVKKEFEVCHIDHSLEVSAILRVEMCASKIKK